MTVSGYVTNQSVFTIYNSTSSVVCDQNFFYVHNMYSVGNNTCPLNLRGNDRVTETYRLMQEELGNSVIKWVPVSDGSQHFYDLISADYNEHPQCPWTSRNDESVCQVHHFMWNDSNL